MKKIMFLGTLLVLSAIACSEQPPFTERDDSWRFQTRECQSLILSSNTAGIRVYVNGDFCPPDEAMEQQIRDYYQVKGSQGIKAQGTIEYRQQVCTGLTISASESLFGLEAGSDLSAFFSIRKEESLGKWNYWSLLFSSDRKLLGTLPDKMPVREYVAMNPIILPFLNLVVDEPEKLGFSDEVTVTVSISLSGGKVLSERIAWLPR